MVSSTLCKGGMMVSSCLKVVDVKLFKGMMVSSYVV